jgi:transposase-like protein/IS1 family transposase
MAREKRPKPVHQLTAKQFDTLFKTEDDCIRYLVVRRWPNGVRCPRCDSERVYPVKTMGFRWQCYACTSESYRFSHLTGTIFENTNKPLKNWFRVAHLMLVSKKGMSALQISRYMGFGSYKTAWLMCHKIRTALVEDVKQLGGIVEIDETVIGGDSGNRHWDKRSGQGNQREGKTIVVGAVRRKGNVVARIVENANSETLTDFVNETVSHKVSLLCTDQWAGYKRLAENGYPHQTVDHSAHQYVYGAVHTQTIEGAIAESW